MVCPSCGYLWDTNKKSCQQCGFSLNASVQSGPTTEPEDIWRSKTQPGVLAYSEPSTPFAAKEFTRGASFPVKGSSGNLSASDSLSNRSSGSLAQRGGVDPSFNRSSGSLAQRGGIDPSPNRSSGSLAQRGGVDPSSNRSSGSLAQRGSSGSLSNRSSGSLAQKSSSDPSSYQLSPGTPLRQERYRIQELLNRQVWGSGVYEATWLGRDLQRQKQVKICEVVIPENLNVQTLPIMHKATVSLLAVRHSPHLTPLLDAFSDRGRSFFVFGLPAGETVTARMQRLRHPFAEQAVVDFCLQMVSVLEAFSQQSPSLVHGLISPEHVWLSYDDSKYVLSDFSILVGGGAAPLLSGADRPQLSPYSVPEFARGIIDTPDDLYSVLATAYYLATGSAPAGNSIQHARSLNPALTPAFDAILARGLHFAPRQRYQHPSQLRQDLLALPSQAIKSGPGLYPQEPMRTPVFSGNSAFRSSSPLSAPEPAFVPPIPIAPLALEEEEEVLLPAPETLRPLSMGYERLEAGIMLILILASLGVIVGLSHFHA